MNLQIKRVNYLCLVLIGVVLLFFIHKNTIYATAPITVTFQATLRATTPLFDRPDMYDYAATAMAEPDNHWKVWYCGQDIVNGESGDSIFYASSVANVVDQTPVPVLRHTTDTTRNDGLHACAPTVVKHTTPTVLNGQEHYSLYYECTPKFWNKNNPEQLLDTLGSTQICHAISSDGVNWLVYNNTLQTFGDPQVTDPTPLFTFSDAVKQQCQYQVANGKRLINPDTCTGIVTYGVGHPTAVVKTVNGQQQIWLWYYDSLGKWPPVVYLTKSFDGMMFDTPVATNLIQNVDVKFMDIPVGQYPGYFLATQVISNNNYLAYSLDGINWYWYNVATNPKSLELGLAVASHTAAPAQSAIVGDKFGTLHSPSISMLSGEGVPTNPYYKSWGLWLIQGNLTASSNLPGDINGDGKVDIFDYNLLVSDFGKTGSPGFSPADLDNNGKVDIFDYNILVTNFGKTQ